MKFKAVFIAFLFTSCLSAQNVDSAKVINELGIHAGTNAIFVWFDAGLEYKRFIPHAERFTRMWGVGIETQMFLWEFEGPEIIPYIEYGFGRKRTNSPLFRYLTVKLGAGVQLIDAVPSNPIFITSTTAHWCHFQFEHAYLDLLPIDIGIWLKANKEEDYGLTLTPGSYTIISAGFVF